MDRDERLGLQAAVAAYTIWGFLTIYWKQLAEFDPGGWRQRRWS
jgi:EamA domain-containing membrane protein RarD